MTVQRHDRAMYGTHMPFPGDIYNDGTIRGNHIMRTIDQVGPAPADKATPHGRNEQVNGKDPSEQPNMGTAPDGGGNARAEIKIATVELPADTGNMNHDFDSVAGIRAWKP